MLSELRNGMVNLVKGRGRKVWGSFRLVWKSGRLDEVKLSASSGSDEGEKLRRNI